MDFCLISQLEITSFRTENTGFIAAGVAWLWTAAWKLIFAFIRLFSSLVHRLHLRRSCGGERWLFTRGTGSTKFLHEKSMELNLHKEWVNYAWNSSLNAWRGLSKIVIKMLGLYKNWISSDYLLLTCIQLHCANSRNEINAFKRL